jgi:sugar lactone lactonase YvrE
VTNAFGSSPSSLSPRLSSWIPNNRRRLARLALPWLGLALALGENGAAQTRTATSTALTVTAGGSAVTSAAAGTMVTLTATVKAGTTALKTGQVNFCDATAKYCTDVHVLGMAQLTSAGTATLKLRPGIGSHTYKAVFLGTNIDAGSSSASSALRTTGKHATVTTIAQNYDPGYYTLTATVAGIIDAPGIAAPTGSVSFVDTSNGNSVLGNATVSSGTLALALSGALTSITVPSGMGIATADFNGDGIPDLAVGAMNDGTAAVSILLGNGDGTFTAVASNPVVGGYPYSVVTGDFNGDGISDLAVGNILDSTVTILLGKGDGTFTASPTLTISSAPQSLAIGDFNGNGIPDLAVVAGSSVLVFLGKGDGTFQQTTETLSAGTFPQGITAGDLNGDGIPDLVVANDANSGSVTIFLGNGDGTFKTGTEISGTGSGTISVAIADFNGDGIPDLAVTNYSDDTVGILLGEGNATFEAPVFYSVSGINQQSVTAADFNGDGKADLAIGSGYGAVVILPGNGDGTFGSPVYAGLASLYPSGFLAVADYNGDGLPDIAEPDQTSANVAIFLNQQSQTVTAAIDNVNSTGAGQQQVVAEYPGDVNYVASTSSSTPLISVVAIPVISPGTGNYSSAQTVKITDATPGATIYYQASGVTQTSGYVVYTGPIQLSEGGYEVIYAYATETGYQQSNEAYASYALNLPLAPAPTFSIPASVYSGPQSVKITDTAANATIYYTINGVPPTTASAQYTGPITVSGSETLAAVAIANGYSVSPATSAAYVISSVASPFIDTFAGTNGFGYAGDSGPATAAVLNDPADVATDSAGNLYIADANNNVIRKVAAGTGIITTVAGNSIPGYSGDGGPAARAEFQTPIGVAVDAAGDIYLADSVNCVVRKVTASTGDISTYAGSGTCGNSDSGDNGPATSASLDYPGGLAIDASGNLYIADLYGQRVRKVAASSGTITTYAGGGTGAHGTGSGGLATSASLSEPGGLAFDGSGNLYIADFSGNVVWEVNASTQIITIVAGDGFGANEGAGGYTGDGGPATSAELYLPTAVVVDKSGNLYIADSFNEVIREVTASTGIINTIAGNGNDCYALSGDGSPAGSASLCNPRGLALDTSGNLYIADENESRVRIVTMGTTPTKAATTPAFSVPGSTYSGPQSVSLTDPAPGAAIYVTYNGTTPTTLNDQYRGAINVNGSVTLSAVAVAPGFLPSAPVSATYTLSTPPPAVVSTVAGRGASNGSPVAGQPATSTFFTTINSVAIDAAGNLYIPDAYDDVVWKVPSSTGIANILAGTIGSAGYSGDSGPATNAQLSSPVYVALDSAGNLYISDSGNRVVRQVNATTGTITTYAGDYYTGSSLGDGGPATSAHIYPSGLAFDAANNLYIADGSNQRIREVTASTGIISTVAGGAAYNAPLGDGGPATAARLVDPLAVVLDQQGDLYIADTGDYRVRLVNAASGNISTIAGNGDRGSSGDGLPAIQAEIDPFSLALDAFGDLYIADGTAVRELASGSQALTTIAGNGYVSFDGDGRSASLTGFCDPNGLAFDPSGNLLVSDYCNVRIRKIAYSNTVATPTFNVSQGTYASSQSIEIASATKDAVIYYTTDGSTPTPHSTVYTSAITVTQTETIKAIAVAGGYSNSPIAAATYTIGLVTPTVTVTPSASSITTAQSLTVSVTVSGGTGNPVPTGAVTLTSGTYSVQQNLASGSTAFSIDAGTLPVGTDTLKATYAPDSASSGTYVTATQSSTVSVSPPLGSGVATVSVTPTLTKLTNAQAETVAVAVSGGSGQPTPTGSAILSVGTWSDQQSLSNGSATFTVPSGTLSVGTDTLTAAYSGDVNYAVASGTATVTVSQILSSGQTPSPVSPGSSATSTITFSAGTTYSGTLNLTCALTTSPNGAQSLPTCSMSPTSVTLTSGGSGTSTLTVGTTAASTTALLHPFSAPLRWLSGGGATLAALLLFGIPARRRRWASLFALLLAIVAFGAIGCGGGGSGGGGGGGQTTPATTAGNYTLTVTGTDSVNAQITTSTTVVVTVQ